MGLNVEILVCGVSEMLVRIILLVVLMLTVYSLLSVKADAVWSYNLAHILTITFSFFTVFMLLDWGVPNV